MTTNSTTATPATTGDLSPEMAAALQKMRAAYAVCKAYDPIEAAAKARYDAAIAKQPDMGASERQRTLQATGLADAITTSNAQHEAADAAAWEVCLLPVSTARDLAAKLSVMVEHEEFTCPATPDLIIADVARLVAREA